MLSLKEKITLDGIISFLNAKLGEKGHDEAVVKFLKRQKNHVTEMRGTLDASSAEEDHVRETFSRVKSMYAD